MLLHRFAQSLRVSPVYLSLLGGVFLSLATSSYMAVYGVDLAPRRSALLLLSSACALAAGICWSTFAVMLDGLQRVALVSSPDWIRSDRIWEEVVRASLLKFLAVSLLALATSAGSILVLQLGTASADAPKPVVDRVKPGTESGAGTPQNPSTAGSGQAQD